MVLQPDEFKISDIVKPNGKLGIFAETVLKYRNKGMTIYDSMIKASEEADYYSGSFPKTFVEARNAKNDKPKFRSKKRISDAIRNSLDFYLKRNKVVEVDDDIEVLYLSEKTMGIFNSCMEGVGRSRFNNLLRPQGFLNTPDSYNEYAILCELEWIDEETGEITPIKIKGKLDNFTVDHEEKVITLNDLKTTGKPVGYFMGNKFINNEGEVDWINGSFQKFHYYRQFGLYYWLLAAALKQVHGLKGYTLKANLLVVETIPEFNSKIYKVTNNHIKAGLSEFKQLLGGYVDWKKNQNT